MRPEAIIEREFPQRESLIYLNHAGVAPWPRRTAEAIKQFAEENVRQGPVDYARWLGVEKDLRGQLRQLLNAPSSEDIALLKNTSEGLSVVAYGLPWQRGDNVVISDQEFPSNRIVWESLQHMGVEVRVAGLDTTATPEEAIIEQINEHTRLVSISSVQYATGLRMDLDTLGAYCRDHDVLFCVDAIQSLGALRMDVQAIHADFVMADGHKWMLGPEGVAVFYCRPEVRDRLSLRQFGWHMVEHHGDYDRKAWEVARSARRFECGSPNMLGIHGLNASLSLLLEIGMEDIEQMILEQSSWLINVITEQDGLDLITPAHQGRYAGIVTLKHMAAGADKITSYLRGNGIVCAVRGGGIRLSPHFYTSTGGLEKALRLAMDYP